MNIEGFLRRCRASYRALFAPDPPPRLDGPIIQIRTLIGGKPWSQEEWLRQADIRGEENRRREEEFRRGGVI